MLKINLAALLGLEEFLNDDPERTRKAASLAMNDVLSGAGLARFRRAVNAEVNFPAGYVDDRLTFGTKATTSNLTASIVARQRPTSLARFASGATIGSKGGVSVRVKKGGGGAFMKNAFLVRLRAGAAASEDSFNTGLAIRLKPGQTVLGKKDTSNMVRLDTNVVLLYGPSVDQIVRNEVAEAETPEVVDAIGTEFFRQYARLAVR